MPTAPALPCSNASRRPALASARGMMLLELIIASALSVVVCAMMFSVLGDQERAAARMDASANLQDSLRFALQTMTKQIRMAGYGTGFSVTGSQDYPGMPTLRFNSNAGRYDFDGSTDTTTGSDWLTVVYRNPLTEFLLNAEEMVRIQPSCSASEIYAGSPIATVPEEVNPVAISGGETLVCYDESEAPTRRALAWEVAGATSLVRNSVSLLNVTIRLKPNSSAAYTAACPSGGIIPPRMTCGLLRSSIISFYLRNETLWMDDDGDAISSVSGTLTLAQADPTDTDDIPIARGIEDVQYAICVSSADDETSRATSANACLTDSNSTRWLRTGTLAAADVSRALAVRVTLVAKGQLDKARRKVVSTRPTNLEDHVVTDTVETAARPSSTRYPRMVQSVVVQLPTLRYMGGFTWN